MPSIHVPILVEPIISSLIPPFQNLDGEGWFLDCTFGGGGHTLAFLQALEKIPQAKSHKVIGVDRDLSAIERGRNEFQKWIQEGKLELQHREFSNTLDILEERRVFGILADFGFSSDQLEDQVRGFSFKKNGPLDMRMDQTAQMGCIELLSQISEEDLEELIRTEGEEPFSKRIARRIIILRGEGHLPRTTHELSQAIIQALPAGARHQKMHGATRTFQALRMRVNQELSQIDILLDHIISKVQVGGRVGVISFHSLEDRKVKNYFKNSKLFSSLHKKAIQADYQEILRNPRARSAKLRLAERKG